MRRNKMDEEHHFFVLVNTFDPKRLILCDYEGETYASLGEALVARDVRRGEADNPWIDVCKLVPLELEDLNQDA
ncbi:hypothetical protein MYX77_02880 [Acidobacteriia bacterium AH_259_A11_L15]|nr:hypothetical protein [Acidobacteriia bacterium AH_259_A11_L15]